MRYEQAPTCVGGSTLRVLRGEKLKMPPPPPPPPPPRAADAPMQEQEEERRFRRVDQSLVQQVLQAGTLDALRGPLEGFLSHPKFKDAIEELLTTCRTDYEQVGMVLQLLFTHAWALVARPGAHPDITAPQLEGGSREPAVLLRLGGDDVQVAWRPWWPCAPQVQTTKQATLLGRHPAVSPGGLRLWWLRRGGLRPEPSFCVPPPGASISAVCAASRSPRSSSRSTSSSAGRRAWTARRRWTCSAARTSSAAVCRSAIGSGPTRVR